MLETHDTAVYTKLRIARTQPVTPPGPAATKRRGKGSANPFLPR